MRSQTQGDVPRVNRSVPRHRLRLAVLAVGTAGGLVTLFHYDGALSARAAPASGTSGRAGAAAGKPATGRPAAQTVLGDPANTRWGAVQVRLTVRDGKVTSATAVRSPRSTEHSQEINARALPILDREAVQAQSGQLDAVSGATVTSEGYRASLQSALDKAHLG